MVLCYPYFIVSYVIVGVCVCVCGWFGNCSFIFSFGQSDLLALRQSLLLVIFPEKHVLLDLKMQEYKNNFGSAAKLSLSSLFFVFF